MSIPVTYNWIKTADQVPTVADARPFLGRQGSPTIVQVQGIYTVTEGPETGLTQAVTLSAHVDANGVPTGAGINDFDLNVVSNDMQKLLDDPNSVWVALDSNPYDASPPVGPTFNHLVNRTQIVETVAGVESVLANYDYTVEPFGEQFAQGYIDTFGGSRDLRIAYFAEPDVAGSGLATYAIVEELLDENSLPYETVVEVKTTEAYAQGYVNIFSGTTRVLRVATLQETTQPVA